MTTFWKRLRYYGIGFGIGCIFVFFFFQNRACSWLPDNRIKNSILDRTIVIQEDESDLLKSKGIKDDEIIEILNSGKINFKLSDKNSESKVYLLYKDDLKLFFTLPEESYISEVKIANVAVSKIKNSTTGMGRFIHFPNEENLVYVDSLSILSCQQAEIGMTKNQDILKNLKKNGTIDFSKTNFNGRPKPEHYINFSDSIGRKIGAKSIWYKNRITIFEFNLPFETTCN
jgi:hypothetical protein